MLATYDGMDVSIRQLRERLGLNRTEFGRKIGVATALVRAVEEKSATTEQLMSIRVRLFDVFGHFEPNEIFPNSKN